MFYTHGLHTLADTGLHPSTVYLGIEVTSSPNVTEMPFMPDQVTIICLPFAHFQSSYFSVWFLRHFRWSYISEIQHTHITKHWSAENKNLKNHGFKILQNFFWPYSELHKSKMASLKTTWKRKRMFCKTPFQRTCDCEEHAWGNNVPLLPQNSMLGLSLWVWTNE